MTTPTGPSTDDSRVLAEVRAVLAAFNWESDDRQLALEEIARITGEWGI